MTYPYIHAHTRKLTRTRVYLLVSLCSCLYMFIDSISFCAHLKMATVATSLHLCIQSTWRPEQRGPLNRTMAFKCSNFAEDSNVYLHNKKTGKIGLLSWSRIFAKKPHVSAKEPWISSKKPHVYPQKSRTRRHTKEGCLYDQEGDCHALEKRPQKESPVYPQERHRIHPQKKPTQCNRKRAVSEHIQEQHALTIKEEIAINCKRALYIRKRALNVSKKKTVYTTKYPKKSPQYPQKSPLYPQKSFKYPQKTPVYTTTAHHLDFLCQMNARKTSAKEP